MLPLICTCSSFLDAQFFLCVEMILGNGLQQYVELSNPVPLFTLIPCEHIGTYLDTFISLL